jgi:hypothetical protein
LTDNFPPCRHSRESGNPEHKRADWVPAFAGMTKFVDERIYPPVNDICRG